jgi:polar amino acid transport system substrate-binding protein
MRFAPTIAAALSALLLTAFANTAGAARIDDIRARGFVRIGVSLGGEPIGFRDAHNEPVGYDVDVARQLAAKLGVPVKFSDVSGDARISMLLSGQLDAVVGNTSITPQRSRVVDFSIPYNRAGLRIIVQKDAGIRTAADLAGKRVVVGRGTTSAAFLKQTAPRADIVYTDNFAPDGVLLLQQKRVDAGIEDSSLLDYLASKNPQLLTLPELYSATPIGIAVAKGDPAFLALVNDFVGNYIKSGAYAANYKKWWGAKATPPVLTPTVTP